MYARKILLETDVRGRISDLPVLPANKKVEVIFLILDDITGKRVGLRKPHADILGKIEIHGDILNTVHEELWDLPI